MQEKIRLMQLLLPRISSNENTQSLSTAAEGETMISAVIV